MRPARYLLVLAAMILVGMGAIGTFNALVDPLELLDLSGAVGLDTRKPLVNVYARVSKAAVDCRMRPSFVILGTSRSQHALDPQWPGLENLGYRGFNLAFPGANIYEIRRAFENATACGSVQGALIELDFLSFNIHSRSGAPDFEEGLFRHSRRDWLRPALEILRLLTSLDMAKESILTLQAPPGEVEFEPNGRENDVIFERRVVTWGGVRGAFRRSERAQYAGPILATPFGERPHFRFPDGTANLADLEKILATARRNDVHLWFYFAPVHARQLELYRELDLWPQLEDWKATLVRSVYSWEDARATSATVQIWDFSGYNSVTTETVPAIGDSRSRMVGYWESSHIRKRLGDMMLARMFGTGSQQAALQLPADFGVRVTPANIDADTRQIRADARRYQASHPLEEAEVKAEVDNASNWQLAASRDE